MGDEKKYDTPPRTVFGSGPDNRGHVIIIRRDHPSFRHDFTWAAADNDANLPIITN